MLAMLYLIPKVYRYIQTYEDLSHRWYKNPYSPCSSEDLCRYLKFCATAEKAGILKAYYLFVYLFWRMAASTCNPLGFNELQEYNLYVTNC